MNHETRQGLFVCAGCEALLLRSDMKYDSGTGWQRFFTSLPGVFEMHTDHKLFLPRTEYHCARWGGHHGHVFDDGPQPSGMRQCNSGIALKLVRHG